VKIVLVVGAVALGLIVLALSPIFLFEDFLSGGTIGLTAQIGPVVKVGPVSPPAAIVQLDQEVQNAPASLVPCSIPARVLLAQQSVESSYNPTAISPAGAEGIAQFEPTTFPSYATPVPPGGANPPTPFDPVDAAYAEARFLCAHGAQYDLFDALVAYNCGSVTPVCLTVSSGYADEIISLAESIPT
jgi:hypothetical protein